MASFVNRSSFILNTCRVSGSSLIFKNGKDVAICTRYYSAFSSKTVSVCATTHATLRNRKSSCVYAASAPSFLQAQSSQLVSKYFYVIPQTTDEVRERWSRDEDLKKEITWNAYPPLKRSSAGQLHLGVEFDEIDNARSILEACVNFWNYLKRCVLLKPRYYKKMERLDRFNDNYDIRIDNWKKEVDKAIGVMESSEDDILATSNLQEFLGMPAMLFKDDLSRLLGTNPSTLDNYLDRNAIDLYLGFLINRNFDENTFAEHLPSVDCLSCEFSHHLADTQNKTGPTLAAFRSTRMLDCDVLLVPVIQGDQGHYTACIVDNQLKRVVVIDPLENSLDTKSRPQLPIVNDLRNFLNHWSVMINNYELDWSDYTYYDFKNDPHTSKQQNGFDCGVVTSKYMDMYTRRSSLKFPSSTNDMQMFRRLMAFHIYDTYNGAGSKFTAIDME